MGFVAEIVKQAVKMSEIMASVLPCSTLGTSLADTLCFLRKSRVMVTLVAERHTSSTIVQWGHERGDKISQQQFRRAHYDEGRMHRLVLVGQLAKIIVVKMATVHGHDFYKEVMHGRRVLYVRGVLGRDSKGVKRLKSKWIPNQALLDLYYQDNKHNTYLSVAILFALNRHMYQQSLEFLQLPGNRNRSAGNDTQVICVSR